MIDFGFEIKKIFEDYDVNVQGDSVVIDYKDWESELIFKYEQGKEEENLNYIIEELRRLKDAIYLDNGVCLYEDCCELLVTIPEMYRLLNFDGYSLDFKSIRSVDKIVYDIGNISDTFLNILQIKGYFNDLSEILTTLKIYNTFSDSDGPPSDLELLKQKVDHVAKMILFELSYKYSVELKLIDIPEDDDDYDPIFDMTEKLNSIKAPFLNGNYDRDLIEYYYRAIQMPHNEFKYLAFYQVLECLFDEVYISDTVQDVMAIINSGWFSSYNSEHIGEIISIVEQYSKSKNDREKLRLVLDKYFRCNTHDEAFMVANQDIVEILRERLEKITKPEELKDLQKLANIIYDYRCCLTHSNRKYPYRVTIEATPEELDAYIELVKKLSERVIMNYSAT